MGRFSLEVKFRRGSTWHVGRICLLHSDKIVVATNGPPRRGDIVEIELSSDAKRIVVTAQVEDVPPPDDGRVTFRAQFTRPLVVEAIIGSGPLMDVDASPPPPRREARYPISWPLVLRTEGEIVARALDVSISGLFIAANATPGRRLAISMPIDDDARGDARLIARVVRALGKSPGHEQPATSGIGVELVDEGSDHDRFTAFVVRVARRSERRLLVAAAADRLPSLLREQSGLGYVAEGCFEHNTLLARLETGRPPDLVIVHNSFAGRREALALLEERGVATLATDGFQFGRAVDRRLAIESSAPI
jgi:hypothetical protein